MATTKRASVSSVSVSINPNGPRKQNADMINKLVAQALGRGGCEGCGRIAYFKLDFVTDPGPDMEKLGAISVDVRAS